MKIIMMLLLLAPLAGATTPMPTDEELDMTLAQTMEISQRVSANGMSFQVLKRCGASADTLKKVKAYLYKDIEQVRRQTPAAKVDIDGLFAFSAKTGDEHYEAMKGNPKFCSGMLEQASKYIAQ